MNQINDPGILQPFPPLTVPWHIIEAALPKWIEEAQEELQTNTPYGIIDLSLPIIIFDLMQRKRHQIHSAYFMKGGWEGWFQVELALFLEEHGYIVEREAHVFIAPRETADLVVTSCQVICTIIELKCESPQDITGVQLARAGTPPKFQKRIERDLDKFGAGGCKIRNEHLGKFFCCVGVSGNIDTTLAAVGSYGTAKIRFNGLSLDRIAMFAEEHDLMEYDNIDESPCDDLLMWWSGVHQKILTSA